VPCDPVELPAVVDGSVLGGTEGATVAGTEGDALIEAAGTLSPAPATALAGWVLQAPRMAAQPNPAAATTAPTRTGRRIDRLGAADSRPQRRPTVPGNIKTPVISRRSDVETLVSCQTPEPGAGVAGPRGQLAAETAAASSALICARTHGLKCSFARECADLDGLTHIPVPPVATNQ
jgi:hypothetical protein